MNKITQKMFREYRHTARLVWHDQEWHDFMNSDWVTACEYADEEHKRSRVCLKTLVETANRYYQLYRYYQLSGDRT